MRYRVPRPRREEPRGRAREEERQTLLDSLAQTRTLIAQAYSGFNTAADPDLIESYVFEINALHARYTYLLRRVKELDSGSAPLESVSSVPIA